MIKGLISFIKFIVTFAIFFAIIFGILNYPAIETYVESADVPGEHIVDLHDKNIFTEVEAKTLPKFIKNHLIIPVLSIDVPVVWQSKETAILANLKRGVVRYPSTALPGEQGNVFLVGHSSNWLWEDGKYKNVFANINQLKKNDEIIIRTDDTYIYRVYAKEVVSPNDVSVLKSNSESIISLMTCYPIGTTWKRLIVRAEQVWPASTGDKVENLDLQQIKLLPSIR